MSAQGLDFLDQKVVKAPTSYNGDRTRWKHFNVKLKGFVNGLSPPLKHMFGSPNLAGLFGPNKQIRARRIFNKYLMNYVNYTP